MVIASQSTFLGGRSFGVMTCSNGLHFVFPILLTCNGNRKIGSILEMVIMLSRIDDDESSLPLFAL